MRLAAALVVVGCGLTAFSGFASDRDVWIAAMERIAGPVVENLARGSLDAKMPHRSGAVTDFASRLEAVGRTFCGILPWFELSDDDTAEGRLRAKWRVMVKNGLANAVAPDSPSRLVFSDKRRQPLVDAAFLAHGLLRAPRFWSGLDADVKANVIERMKETRDMEPYDNNWLLFAGIIEAFLLDRMGTCDEERLMRGVKAFLGEEGWYVGDGFYSDGSKFALDGYNSFVIQPMLWDIVAAMERAGRPEAKSFLQRMKPRFRRHADILERLIAPDGTYPLVGRSVCYRFGFFQHLAMSVMLGDDFHSASNGAIRSALTAVIRRQCVDANFDSEGWLTVGFQGFQPDLAEPYISRGSLYLACAVFLPLGLPPDHPFWTASAADWTQKAVWSGRSADRDKRQ